MLHVWNIYLHLSDMYGKIRKNIIHTWIICFLLGWLTLREVCGFLSPNCPFSVPFFHIERAELKMLPEKRDYQSTTTQSESFHDKPVTPLKTNMSPQKGTILVGNTSSNH